jgi:hypothetical protein
LEVIIDIDNKKLAINKLFNVVENKEEINDYAEITEDDAKKHDPNLKVGDVYKEMVHLSELSKLSLGIHLSQMLKHNVTNQSNKQVYSL